MTTVNDNKIIEDLLCDYDNNNANMRGIGGSLEYSLFEHLSKKMITHFLNPEWSKAEKEGVVYAHDKAQYLFKGLNCFTHDIRRYIRFGLSTYGDNSGVVSKPPNHFRTVLELSAQAMGLASCYMAGGQAIAALNTFVAPFMEGMSDKHIKQDIQAFLFQLNQSFMNRGCVSGDTEIWVKINGNVELKTFKELSDLFDASYGWNDLTDFDVEVLTLTNDRIVKWMKPSLFVRNEPRNLYEVQLRKGRSFKCDSTHGLIRYSDLSAVNIFDIKKGTHLADPIGINQFVDIEHNSDYWNGVLYGFWLGDGHKKGISKYRTCITVGKQDKKDFLDLLFSKLNIEFNKTVTQKKIDHRHKIPEYNNYYFNLDVLVKPTENMENKNYLAGLITGLINSDGNLRMGTSGNVDCQLKMTDKNIIDLCRYAFYFFGIRANLSVKDGEKSNHSKLYRLNFEDNKNARYLYNQLEFRSLFKEALNSCKPIDNYYGSVKRANIIGLVDIGEMAETYCFTVNGRMIITSGFILTTNCQSVFSSINMDLEMPEWLKSETAYGKKGEVVGKYGDFYDESKRFVHLLNEVSIDGDGNDKPLFFPNLIYNIPNADLREWKDIFELSAKFSTPYFCNYIKNGVKYQSTLGCRSAQPANWTGDPNIDCMGTGNSVYTTVSLPAIALKSVCENKNFINELVYYMGLIRSFNKERLEWIRKLWYTYHTADFLIKEDENGTPLYRLNDATIVLGYLGLSEALEILYGKDITQLPNKAREIIKFMRDEIARWKVEDNLRWGLFQTPAENLAYTNAKKMVEQYGFKRSKAKGNRDAPFYTNSNHVPVDSDINLIERIKLEGNNQPLGAAGNIMNVYLGESYSEPTALLSLCEKIRDNCNAYFWAFTGDFSMCPECLTKFKGAVERCGFCGSETDVFSRVTGYMTVTKSWNKGKKSEHKLRHRYEVKGGLGE